MCYYLVQVRLSSIADKSIPDTPTAVLVHGILGSQKNWGRLFFLPTIYMYVTPNLLKYNGHGSFCACVCFSWLTFFFLI